MSSVSCEGDPIELALIISKLKGTDNNVRSNGVAVRFRPVIRSVLRRHVFAYALSILQKHCFTCTNVIASPLATSTDAVNMLLKELKKENVEVFEFSRLQAICLASLNKYLDILVDTNRQTPSLPWLHVWRPLGIRVEATSLVNRRRRQEDRWFAVADVLHYISPDISGFSYESRLDSRHVIGNRFPRISAFGVFDGHGGPEAAEHCSHLAPFLLCTGLRDRLCSRWAKPPAGNGEHGDPADPICCIDLLAEVFCRLNQSVDECRMKKMWNSGTTGTICLLVKETVYTAWVGDSQCWLYYREEERADNLSMGNERSLSLTDDRRVQEISAEEPADGATQRPTVVAVALTDRIHRPEFPPEFVSILRSGGSVSMQFSGQATASEGKQAAEGEGVMVFTGLDPAASTATTGEPMGLTKVPPLASPSLSDCRVDAVSSVSRSIGDSCKIPSISPLPSATVHRLRRGGHQRPLCLVMASDGLWDADGCSGKDLSHVISSWNWSGPEAGSRLCVDQGPSKQLCQLAVNSGASDNVTCLLVHFDQLDPQLSGADRADAVCRICVKTRWPLGARVASAPDSLHDYYAREVHTRGPRCSRWDRVVMPPRPQSCTDSNQVSCGKVRLSSPPR